MENKTEFDTKINTNNITSGPVTSPISQEKLVSRVNALTFNTTGNPILNPKNMVFNNEKGSTLNYKHVVEGLINLSDIDNLTEYHDRIYSIITKDIDSRFYAIGLYKEQSNCINIRLQDKLGNNYSSKIFLTV